MKLSFDKFERYELPQVTLCNPSSRATEVDGKIMITDTVGVLSNPKEMNLKLNFNAPHELSFDYYLHKNTDPIKQSFYDSIYEAIQTDRYVYLADIGYFIISNISDSDEDNIDKKSISLKSCEENEFTIAEGLYLEEGTYYLHTENNDGLIDLFFKKTMGWTIGFIDPSLLTKPYFVEKIDVDNGYNFLYTTIQNMFECIVEPDIIRRTVSIYSRTYYAENHLTDIHIAKYNLLKHKIVEENDEDKYTALNVQGKDESLDIRAVNPIGTNTIYNFEPRYSWMSAALQNAIVKWQEKCMSVEQEYLLLQQQYYIESEKLFNAEKDIGVLNVQLDELLQTRDLIISGDYDTEQYETQQSALDDTNALIDAKQNDINTANQNYNYQKEIVHDTYEVPIKKINSDCALSTTAIDIHNNVIFTTELLNELMAHIKPTEYVDEYMLVTESMTCPQRFEKAKELMDRAQSQLVKISSGQKTYSIDTRSFLFNKQFKHFSEQLCAGAIIYVETKKDSMEQLHLTGIDISFDDKSTNFTLGNKYDRSDLKALYEDALGQNSKSFSELKYIASIVEDQQKYHKRDWAAELRTLTLNNILTSEDQAIEINNRGLIGRKRQLNEDGSWKNDENGNPLFDPEQVKLINNTLVFTDENWQNATTAVGKIAVGYNPDGSVKYSYGINGQVIIGELFLGNNLVLTGTSAGIKIKDSKGNNAFYADDNGNLTLSGIIFAKGGTIGGWTIGAKDLYYGDNYSESKMGLGSTSTEWAFWAGTYTKSDGTKEANFRVTANGELYSTSGNIGGWDIGTYTISKTSGGLTTGLQSPNSGTWAIAVGATNRNKWVTAPFRVDHYGNMHSQSGEIGGWKINENCIYNTSPTGYNFYLWNPAIAQGDIIVCTKDSSYPFRVTRDGILHCTGANIEGIIHAKEGGTIGGWNITSSSIIKETDDFKVFLHAPTSLSNSGGEGDVLVVGNKSAGTWPFILKASGQLTCTDATITGTINATSGVFERDIKIGNRSISNWITDGGYIKEIKATTGTVGGWTINSTSIYGDDSSGYAVRLQPDKLYVTDSNRTFSTSWYSIYSAGAASDVRLKHGVSSIHDQYEKLFDKLLPKTFYYTAEAEKGSPEDLHFGFVAQDILKIQNELGLDNLSFVFNEQYYGLKINEFIALNTWQIQKTKARIADLENTVAELQTQIQILTAG